MMMMIMKFLTNICTFCMRVITSNTLLSSAMIFFFNPLSCLLDFKSWFNNKCITCSSKTLRFLLLFPQHFISLISQKSSSPMKCPDIQVRCFQDNPLGGSAVLQSRKPSRLNHMTSDLGYIYLPSFIRYNPSFLTFAQPA